MQNSLPLIKNIKQVEKHAFINTSCTQMISDLLRSRGD